MRYSFALVDAVGFEDSAAGAAAASEEEEVSVLTVWLTAESSAALEASAGAFGRSVVADMVQCFDAVLDAAGSQGVCAEASDTGLHVAKMVVDAVAF